jgi:cytochrome c-type biogenesis protein CcmE
MKPKSLFGLVAMIGFGAVLLLNFGSQVGGYMDFESAEASGSQAHVVGMWVDDQAMAYDRDRNVFSFTMKDEQGNVRRVEYRNPKPANFEDAERLVIEGRARGDVFEATHILVKCPSKYNDERALQQMQQTAH